MLSNRTAALLCLLTGVSLEVIVTAVTGRREAWDTAVYWTAGVPAAIAVSILVGLMTRGQGWLTAGLIVPAQLTAMVMRSGGSFGLWPLTLVAGFVVGAPLILTALAANRFRSRRQR